MKRLVEFPLEVGGQLVVQVDETTTEVTRGLRRRESVAEKTTKTFEEATASVTPAAQSLISRLKNLDTPPQEIGVEFGL